MSVTAAFAIFAVDVIADISQIQCPICEDVHDLIQKAAIGIIFAIDLFATIIQWFALVYSLRCKINTRQNVARIIVIHGGVVVLSSHIPFILIAFATTPKRAFGVGVLYALLVSYYILTLVLWLKGLPEEGCKVIRLFLLSILLPVLPGLLITLFITLPVENITENIGENVYTLTTTLTVFAAAILAIIWYRVNQHQTTNKEQEKEGQTTHQTTTVPGTKKEAPAP